MKPRFFTTSTDFREWLEGNHQSEVELLVGFYKVNSGKVSISWSESVDQALCFGWIDGVRKSVDHESYTIRFTPRKSNSIWSTINIKKIEELSRMGLMKESGLKAYSLRTEGKSGIYSHEKEPTPLNEYLESLFKDNKAAWDFFIQQAPSYKKVIIHWIMSAKREKTKFSRLEKVIWESEQQKKAKIKAKKTYGMVSDKIYNFKAQLERIGINPFVFLPTPVLEAILYYEKQYKGKIPVKGSVNNTDYRQTLVKYSGEWRLYINTTMLKNSPKRIGELLDIHIGIDEEERKIEMHPKLVTALEENPVALEIFNRLRPSLRNEIVKYISHLKTEQSVDKNVEKAIQFLLGNERFAGRDKPEFKHIKNP